MYLLMEDHVFGGELLSCFIVEQCAPDSYVKKMFFFFVLCFHVDYVYHFLFVLGYTNMNIVLLFFDLEVEKNLKKKT